MQLCAQTMVDDEKEFAKTYLSYVEVRFFANHRSVRDLSPHRPGQIDAIWQRDANYGFSLS